MKTNAPLLEMRGISKEFPGVKVLSDINLEVQTGEVHAICGENGAGKSTLMKILSGLYPFGSFHGTMRFLGSDIRFGNIRDAQKSGIAIVYQELSLFDELTVAENIFISRLPRRFGVIQWSALFAEASSLLSDLGFPNIAPGARLGDLGIGAKQIVEIAKAMCQSARLVIFDEPTSALAEHEVAAFLNLLRRLRSRNISSLLITHKLQEVFAVADRISVFRDGKLVTTKNANSIDESELIKQMVGRELKEMFPPRKQKDSKDSQASRPVFEVKNLTIVDPTNHRHILKDISFALKAGEVLGISGLMGSGRTELMQHIFAGEGKRVHGEIALNGTPLRVISPRSSIARGLAMVTEDRKGTGLILQQSVRHNMALASLDNRSRLGFIDEEGEILKAQTHVKEFRIKTLNTESLVSSLSGGNQQKVVLTKWVLTKPKILILDEPTRGIDVGARYEIYAAINSLAESGVGIILVSSDLPEVMGMSDRILVLCDGKMTGTLKRNEFSQEIIMKCATAFDAKKDRSNGF